MIDSFRIVPGDERSTLIIHVPHSSRLIPADVRAGIMLDDTALARELDAMTDALTDVIAESAAERVTGERPWLFVNGLSRLVVDPERFPDEREEMNAVGMGAVYTRGSGGQTLRDLPDDEISGLVERFFTPYAAAFAELVDQRLAAIDEVTIIDMHSYPLIPNPYELHLDGPRPEICLGTNEFHTPPVLKLMAQDAFTVLLPGASVGENSPFAGCYVPLKHYEADARVSAIMLELRRDTYMDDDFAPIAKGVDALTGCLTNFVVATQARQRLFVRHTSAQALMEAFSATSTHSLAHILGREAGLGEGALDVVHSGGALTLWIGETGFEVAFPVSMFDVIDMVDHVRHREQERQPHKNPGEPT